MNYTLHQLQIFVKIAELQSVTKASEALYLTQPAVSIQLKKLQEQFEIPLTEVIGRNIYVTDFGHEIVAAGKRILAEADLIRHQTMAYKGHLIGQLKIAVVSTGKYVMPYFLAPFAAKHQAINLVMDVTNKASVMASLFKNEVDFALISVVPDELALESVELLENKLYLVGNKPVKGDKKISTKQLGELTYIFREKGSATRDAMEKYMASKEIKPKKIIELTSNEAVKQAVIAGLGYSIMPVIGIKNELTNGDVFITPAPNLPVSTIWRLVWLKTKKFSPATQAYIDFLAEQKETIIKERFSWYDDFK